jgi:hypothetical protein
MGTGEPRPGRIESQGIWGTLRKGPKNRGNARFLQTRLSTRQKGKRLGVLRLSVVDEGCAELGLRPRTVDLDQFLPGPPWRLFAGKLGRQAFKRGGGSAR